ncbi:MAG: type II toxin-antitoxin system VapC family toxin [Sulfuritalea sp.]|nr:type II toxin-antitoxin system VapC family toxin [Sulfuritalea sp.]MDP1982797.1 type II toxin-antitoxin system VapC family toxin [Sulfuritalea sp.]
MIVDASVWVASVLDKDVHHEVGLAFMHRFVKEQQIATVPLLVWAEIAGAVARRTGDTDRGMKVAEFIAAKIWVRGVPLDATLAGESMRLAANLKLRGADAVYVALAATCREPLITLDVEMLERARGVAEAFTPEQWLQAH